MDNINEYSDTEIAVNTEFIRKIALADYGFINRVRQIDSGGVTRDYSRVPLQYIKTDALAPESAYAAESLKCKDTRKATDESSAKRLDDNQGNPYKIRSAGSVREWRRNR